MLAACIGVLARRVDELSAYLCAQAVDVDLGVNAYTNAQNYYQTKKKVAAKMEKTIQSQGKALKGAERKAKQGSKLSFLLSIICHVHWWTSASHSAHRIIGHMGRAGHMGLGVR